jgi:hypothetical protein
MAHTEGTTPGRSKSQQFFYSPTSGKNFVLTENKRYAVDAFGAPPKTYHNSVTGRANANQRQVFEYSDAAQNQRIPTASTSRKSKLQMKANLLLGTQKQQGPRPQTMHESHRSATLTLTDLQNPKSVILASEVPTQSHRSSSFVTYAEVKKKSRVQSAVHTSYNDLREERKSETVLKDYSQLKI